MDPRIQQATIWRSPHAFIDKAGYPILITPVNEHHEEALLAMYLAYQPRNAFWGLPPIQDDACRKWVRGMVRDGANLAALSFNAGVVGHAAVFGMSETVCEMLVVVSPPHQNLGIGTALNAFALNELKTRGIQMVRVETGGDPSHAPARRCYEKAGYTVLPLVRYFIKL